MSETIHSLLAFLVVLGVLVFFHELGHYAAARARGVIVEAFSIGFGPALLSWRAKSGTVWKLSALPLGGYVKMQGWGDEETDAPATPGSFSATSLGSKALIVAAGPLANFILAFVLLTGLYAIVGRPIVQPVVSQVTTGEPAATAGILPGDRITEVNGQPVTSFEDVQQIVLNRPATAITLEFLRNNTRHTVQLTTLSSTIDGSPVGKLGIEGDEFSTQHFTPLTAAAAATHEIYATTRQILNALWNLIVHQQGLQNLGGTIRIAQLSGKVAALGAATFINFIAMISINLGLVNLLPIPILDGGHLLFYGGEALYGQPIPRRAREYGTRFGFAVILSLFTFTTLNDLTRLGAVHWVASLFG